MSAGRGRKPVVIEVSDEERETLQRWVRRHTTSQALAMRCRIVLGASQGRANVDIAADLGCHPTTVGKWRNRFARRRLDGLCDEPRPGPPRTITDAKVEEVLVKTLEETPRGATHWSTRQMAVAVGLSASSISKIWRAFGLKPHRTEDFKISPDPQKGPRRGGFVPQSPRRGGSALPRRENRYPGPRPHRADPPPHARNTPAAHPRLPPVWNHQPPHRSRHGHRPSHHYHDRPPPRRRIPTLLEPHRLRSPQPPCCTCGTRQRLHPQNRHHPTLATTPSTVHVPFHTHLRVVDEPRRAMVLRADHQMATTRHPPIGTRTQRIHQRMDRPLEPRPQTIRLAQNSRPDTQQPHSISSVYSQHRTLGECWKTGEWLARRPLTWHFVIDRRANGGFSALSQEGGPKRWGATARLPLNRHYVIGRRAVKGSYTTLPDPRPPPARAAGGPCFPCLGRAAGSGTPRQGGRRPGWWLGGFLSRHRARFCAAGRLDG